MGSRQIGQLRLTNNHGLMQWPLNECWQDTRTPIFSSFLNFLRHITQSLFLHVLLSYICSGTISSRSSLSLKIKVCMLYRHHKMVGDMGGCWSYSSGFNILEDEATTLIAVARVDASIAQMINACSQRAQDYDAIQRYIHKISNGWSIS